MADEDPPQEAEEQQNLEEQEKEEALSSLDEQYADLLGQVVVVEDKQNKKIIWFGASFIALILTLTFGWAYYIQSKSDQQILQENLQKRVVIRQVLRQESLVVHSFSSTLGQLEKSIDRLLTIASTPLREGIEPPASYISERYEAIVVALEGLLRLELAMQLDSADDGDMAFLRQQLSRIGQLQLEYVDHGVMVRQPLIKGAQLRAQANQLLESNTVDAVKEREAVLEKLEQVENTESFTVVRPALLLGKWYRYQNDQEMAHRCFQIGRSYVEGLRDHEIVFPGRKPEALSSLWNEYVECLEGLAEQAFYEGKHRLCRSYLTRIYHTPDYDSPVRNRRMAQNRKVRLSDKMQLLREDVSKIEQAMKNPLDLPSYPNIRVQDVNWQELWRIFQEQKESNPVVAFVLSGLPDIEKQAILDTNSQEIPETLKIAVVARINELINDPTLIKLELPLQKLSPLAQQIAKGERERVLQKEQLVFLNRDILDQGLFPALAFQALSDGTRLHNAISKKQRSSLLQFYQERMQKDHGSEEEREAQQERIDMIYSGKLTPTFTELHQVLYEKYRETANLLEGVEKIIEQEREALEQVRDATEQLEKRQVVDIDALLQLKEREERARIRLVAARGKRRYLQAELVEAQLDIADLHQPLRYLLAETKQKIVQMEKQLSPDANQGPVDLSIDQVVKQIALKEQYLSLLERLQETKADKRLSLLNKEYKGLSASIEEMQERRKTVKGEQREDLEAKIRIKEGKRGEVLQEFGSLFAPLKEIVEAIQQEEEEIWKAHQRLAKTRSEALAILGTKEVPGLLQQKIAQRTALLLRQDDVADTPLLYESEVRQLTKEIADLQAKLRLLMDQESKANKHLAIVLPDLFLTGSGSPVKNGLSNLQKYLETQEGLLQKYDLLWQQRDLTEKVKDQEEIILEKMRMLTEVLGADNELTEHAVQSSSRLMQQLVKHRNELESARQALQASLQKGVLIDPERFDHKGAGFFLDSADLFQIEHQMGLHIKAYRRAFDERSEVISELKTVLKDTQALQSKQRIAAERLDQAELDDLAPTLAEHETIIQLLHEQLAAINTRLRSMADQYSQQYAKVLSWQKKTLPKLKKLQGSIQNLAKSMARRDKEVKEISSQIFSSAEEIDAIVTSITVDDFNKFEQITAVQKRQLAQLKKLRDVYYRQQHFQAKAVWLTARSLVKQSELQSFSDLIAAEQMEFYQLDDEQRSGVIITEDFNRSFVYSEKFLGRKKADQDRDRANYEQWVHYLEQEALDLFETELPKYQSIAASTAETMKVFSRDELLDNTLFIARSRFMSGQVYLRRALRTLAASRSDDPKASLAVRDLESAKLSFANFLEYASVVEKISEKPNNSASFPASARFPLRLVEEAYMNLATIAGLSNNWTEAIAIYQDLLNLIAKKIEQSEGLVKDARLQKFDARNFLQGNAETAIDPFFVALMGQDPLVHEILYRLGKNYQSLAMQMHGRLTEEISQLRWLPPAMQSEKIVASRESMENKFFHLSQYAIGYLSQLLLAHHQSEYRVPAQLARAKLYELIGEFDKARSDYLFILGDPKEQGASIAKKDRNQRGDLPGDLQPGFAYIALQLGRLYLSENDYDAAAELFQRVQRESEGAKELLISARISYAEALIAKKEWVAAKLFLGELLKEKSTYPLSIQQLFHSDLPIDLAETEANLGLFTTSVQSANRLLKRAPGELVVQGELNLSSAKGMQRLTTSYRDLIRPLARMADHIGRVSELQGRYTKAEQYFAMSAKLYHLVPWQEDRLLKEKTLQEYESFKSTAVLQAEWAQVRADVRRLQASLSVGLQRKLTSFSENLADDPKAMQSLQQSIAQGLEAVGSHQQEVKGALAKVEAFYQQKEPLLPEVQYRKLIEQRREQDRRSGGQGGLIFAALSQVYQEVIEVNQASEILQKLFTKFGQSSVEESLINDFLLSYMSSIPFDQNDRSLMQATKKPLENLLVIEDVDTRLATLQGDLIRWLEERMVFTGLDDSIGVLSPQGAVLEQTLLYQASLLSMIEDYESYIALVQLARDVIRKNHQRPAKWQDSDLAWQIVEIAAGAAEQRDDWKAVVDLHRYLLASAPLFIPEKEQKMLTKEFILAKALMAQAQKIQEDLLFVRDTVEIEQMQFLLDQYQKEGITRLHRLYQLPGQGAELLSVKIQAKQILEEA